MHFVQLLADADVQTWVSIQHKMEKKFNSGEDEERSKQFTESR
jgi:hypothetical protein